MKAIRVSRTGGPEVLELVEIPKPEPAPGQVLVEVEAAGVNFIDTYHRAGLYSRPLPFIPGIEAAGRVVRAGNGVGDFSRGDRVVFSLSTGTYAEFAVADAWKVVRLPQGVDSDVGVAAMCQGMTAHYLLFDSYPVQKGDTVLVHAAAGGVGLFLVQMAKRLGARVIGTASTRAKAELAASAGADVTVNYTEEDFEAVVKKETGGRGVHVVYESVGKDTFDKSLNCLRIRGSLVLFGQSSGPVPPIDPQVLNQKGSLFLTRPSLFHYVSDREELLKRANWVLNAIAAGELKVWVGNSFRLEDAAEAHRQLEGRKTIGKVVLKA